MFHRAKAQHCPACNKELDATTSIQDESLLPKPGNLSICFYCGDMSEFDDNLDLRSLSQEQKAEIKKEDPETWDLLTKASSAIIYKHYGQPGHS